MGIITPAFMLKNKTARALYEEAAAEPIIDYHCHLSPREIAEDRRFRNATELFLGGDHYKWRAMRACGVAEDYITGSAPDEEKFAAFARVMPLLIGNPLYHWTALELSRYFDIDEPLCAENAAAVYAACNARLARPDFSARQLILRSGVRVLCTTDDPQDDLACHAQLRRDGFAATVLPTFRPDKALLIEKDTFVPYMQKNGIGSFDDLCRFLSARAEVFAAAGCRVSDHSFEALSFATGGPCVAFDKKMAGKEPDEREAAAFRLALMRHLAALYTRHNMVMQLHIGALRNNSRTMFARLGPDAGFDSPNDFRVAEPLAFLLSHLEAEGVLPKTVLYNLNPTDNYILATMAGNFQRGPVGGYIQFGAGWWFNDHRDGMEAQMRTLANVGALGTFIGMTTDSRSFVSYPRHEYFRRILCNLLGTWVEDGEYPADMAALSRLVRAVSGRNAAAYFGW